MKKLIVLLIAFMPVFVNGQNTVYFSFQPTDLGVGLRFDHRINENFGVYGSAAYGQYRLPAGGYIKDHLKFAFGGMKYMPPNKDNGSVFHFGGGFVHDLYGETNITVDNFNADVLRPISFECIVGIKTLSNFTLGIRFNFFKVESAIDVGYTF